MSDRLPEVSGGPHLRTIAMPADANAGGSIFGGWTLSQMDLGIDCELDSLARPP